MDHEDDGDADHDHRDDDDGDGDDGDDNGGGFGGGNDDVFARAICLSAKHTPRRNKGACSYVPTSTCDSVYKWLEAHGIVGVKRTRTGSAALALTRRASAAHAPSYSYALRQTASTHFPYYSMAFLESPSDIPHEETEAPRIQTERAEGRQRTS
eukprot:1804075-Pleurochrysis_carterae.AAC.2